MNIICLIIPIILLEKCINNEEDNVKGLLKIESFLEFRPPSNRVQNPVKLLRSLFFTNILWKTIYSLSPQLWV